MVLYIQYREEHMVPLQSARIQIKGFKLLFELKIPYQILLLCSKDQIIKTWFMIKGRRRLKTHSAPSYADEHIGIFSLHYMFYMFYFKDRLG